MVGAAAAKGGAAASGEEVALTADEALRSSFELVANERVNSNSNTNM